MRALLELAHKTIPLGSQETFPVVPRISVNISGHQSLDKKSLVMELSEHLICLENLPNIMADSPIHPYVQNVVVFTDASQKGCVLT